MCAVMALDAPAHQVSLEAVGAPSLLTGLEQPNQASSKFRGLCWDRKHQSWRCRIFYASKVRLARRSHVLLTPGYLLRDCEAPASFEISCVLC